MDSLKATTVDRDPPPPSAPQSDLPAAAPRAPLRTPPSRRRWPWVVGALVVTVIAVGAWALSQPPATPTTTPPVTAPARLIARGKVQPVQQARVGTLAGGVIVRLTAVPGGHVDDQGEIARVRGPNGAIEVLTAPWAGTITAVPVNYGDTVLAGAIVASVGDLSRLQVETTDVDEYLIGKIDRGQQVDLIVDALDGTTMTGVVQRVTLQPQENATGDEHYPVVIALPDNVAGLRPGMSVRATFRD